MKREQMKTILIQTGGAVATVCCPIYGYYPIAMAFFVAAYRCMKTRMLMLPIMLCTFWVNTDIENTVKYGVCMLAAAVIYELIIGRKGVLNNLQASLIMGGIVCVLELAGGFMTKEVLLYIALGGFEALLVMGLSGILHMALTSGMFMGMCKFDGENRTSVPQNTEMVAVGIFVAIIVYAFETTVTGAIPIVETAIYFLILIYAYRYGAGMGGIIGTACGTVLMIVSKNPAYVGTFCLLGVVVGFFNYISKLASVMAYFACLWILALLYVPFILESEQIMGLVVAAVFFLVLPMRFTFSYKQALYEPSEIERIKSGSNRMVETAVVFRRLADSIRRINKENDSIFAAELQLKVAAGTLEKLSQAMLAADSDREQDAVRELLRKAFAKKGYSVKRIGIKKGNREETYIQMTLRTEKGQVETTKEAAGIISHTLGKAFKPTEGCRTIINGEFAGYSFAEEPAFMMLYGSAAVTKDKEEVSGDNFTFTELGTGEVLLGIVDGMGSGVCAGEDSEIVIELLEELLKAGFDEEAALALINSVLLTRETEQNLAAIDMAVGDLYTGRFNFVKLGAAATFIKRNRWVEVLQSTNYPIGILKEVDYENTVKKLYDGDYIIMVSDGILDAVAQSDKEELLSEWISEYDKKNPKEFAQYLLKKAVSETKGRVNDDMTVLVAGIWAKHT